MNTKRIKAFYDFVIVRPDKAEEVTEGGIIVPDSAKQKPAKGVVVAAGPGSKDEPMQPQVDMHVLYSKFSGTEIMIEDETLLIMRAPEILLAIDIAE